MLLIQHCSVICAGEAQHRPNLAVIHQEGVILRDDFDSTENFDKSRWSVRYIDEVHEID